MTYTIQDFLHAIRREQEKRAATYPKIIAKMQKRGASPTRISNALARMNLQNAKILSVYNVLRDGVDYMDAKSAYMLGQELDREMKMRERVYKRFVMLRRITHEAAEEQLAVWRALVQHWENNYLAAHPG